jgi:hypothetical protein
VSDPPRTPAEPWWRRPLGPPQPLQTAGVVAAIVALAVIGGVAGLHPLITFAAWLPFFVAYQIARMRSAPAPGDDMPARLRGVAAGIGGGIVGLYVGLSERDWDPWLPLATSSVIVLMLGAELLWWRRRSRRG